MTHIEDPRPYRPCVGIALFNLTNQVFVGERLDMPGAWQMPQGGIDPGESAEIAFFREMHEELGTDKAQIFHIMPHTLKYDVPFELSQKLWGGQFRGQEQTWIGAHFTGNDDDVRIDLHEHREFGQWQWVDIDHVIELIVPFKRDLYREIVHEFKPFTL
jgi:putative (di)nucleoside polyphosphate hydrolase